MAEMSKGGKKSRKIGREAHHPSHVNYTRGNVRGKNKAKRAFQSNGLAELQVYCDKHNIICVISGKKWSEIHIKNIVK